MLLHRHWDLPLGLPRIPVLVFLEFLILKSNRTNITLLIKLFNLTDCKSGVAGRFCYNYLTVCLVQLLVYLFNLLTTPD
jgi:hypothetical protein